MYWRRYWAAVDRIAAHCAPASSVEDPRLHERGVLLVRFAALGVLMALGLMPFFFLTFEGIIVPAINLAYAGCLAIGPVVMWKTGRVAPAAHWMLGNAWCVLFFESLVLGGVESPAFVWLAMLPIGGLLMVGRSGVRFWGAAIGVAIAAVAVAQLVGWIPHDGAAPADVFNRAVSVGLLGFALSYCGSLYEGEIAALIGRLDGERRAFEMAASCDPLTNLPNRWLLGDRIDQVRARALRNRTLAALLYADLDGFKRVNDRLGHDAGDRVLREVADRLRRHTRACDTVVRLGGDEFVLLVEDLASTADAERVAQVVAAAIEEPHVVGDDSIVVGVSLGIAMIGDDPGDDVSSEALLKRADHAMYEAKRTDRRHVFAD